MYLEWIDKVTLKYVYCAESARAQQGQINDVIETSSLYYHFPKLSIEMLNDGARKTKSKLLLLLLLILLTGA